MKFTFLLPEDNLTGGTRVVAVYANELVNKGHDVLVVNSAPVRLTFKEILRCVYRRRWGVLKRNFKTIPGHISLSGVNQLTIKKRRRIENADLPDADFLISTWWETALWADSIASSKGKKVHLIQGYEIWGGGKEHVDKVHSVLQLNNKKIAISQNLKTQIEGELGNLNIKVVPNAVDINVFSAKPRNKSKVPTVGFIYAHASIKGTDRALKVIKLAREKITEMKVVSFGADELNAELPFPENADFYHLPKQDTLASIYSQCDAWLFVSRVDSFGLPILESMACRTPVVGVSVGAAPQYLNDDNGALISEQPSEDHLIESITKQLLRILELSNEQWLQMSNAAHKRATEYTWSDATDLLLSEVQAL